MTMEDALKKLESFITSLEEKGDLSKRKLEPSEIGIFLIYMDKYQKCLNGLYFSKYKRKSYSVDIYKQHSKKAVELFIQEAILHALDINHKRPDKPFKDRLGESINKLRDKLMTSPTHWKVHMRIGGVAPEGLPYKFGKVEFWIADEHNLEKLKDKHNAIVDSRTEPLETKEFLKTDFEDFIKRYFFNHPIASVEVSACDEEAACSAARRELRLTMDVINFYSGPDLGAQIYFVGELQPTREVLLAFETHQHSYYQLPRRIGPFALLSLKDIEPSGAEKVGFYRINEILAKDDRSQIEERILASVQWAGRAAVKQQQRPEEAFLHYAIALETIMLGRQENKEIAYKLRMRTALLAGETLEKRTEIKKEVRDLYDIRSEIVHSGHYEVTDADVGKISKLTIACIKRILTEKPFTSMTKEQEIDNWFDQAMLSGRLLVDDAQ